MSLPAGSFWTRSDPIIGHHHHRFADLREQNSEFGVRVRNACIVFALSAKMVEIDVTQKEMLMASIDRNKSALREERQRTGRYIAVGTAIFLSLLGAYQAVVRGTPQYAALFAPALIMFIYILWILYASKHQRRAANAKTEQEALVEITTDYPSDVVSVVEEETPWKDNAQQEHHQQERRCMFSRSYSIA